VTDVRARARAIVSQMTLAEKVGQVNQPMRGVEAYHVEDGRIVIHTDFDALLRAGAIGAVYGMHSTYAMDGGLRRDVSPEEGARAIAEIQRIARESSRFSIPLLVSEECPKGYVAAGATTFPSPILYASSFDRELVHRIGCVIAREVRAGGGNVGYAPILDICQDPRWSRIEETFGEDPYLAGELGAAMVEGMQQGEPNTRIASTLKHFAAYGTTEGGRNTAPAHIGPRELFETHLAPFQKAVHAGAMSVMCSYNEIDGIPVSADRWLLTDVLRGMWGFSGFVVSDALAIDELCVGNAENAKHRVAATLEDAAALALRAGVDLSLWDRAFLCLGDTVRSGKIGETVLDEAVGRVLAAKFALGLFERREPDPSVAARTMGAPDHRRLSLEAARESIILLDNARGILPFGKQTRVAVIGPSAHNVSSLLGTYTPPARTVAATTIWQGLRALARAPELVRHAVGCRVRDPSRAGFGEAVALAQSSDVVVAVVGGSSKDDEAVALNAAGQIDPTSIARETDVDCGENVDRAGLGLSGVQTELLRELFATGKDVVVVLVQGRPHDITWMTGHAAALICAWYPGPEGGRAVAEILYGDTNPSGKLTISWPRCTGQIPVFYNHKRSAEKRYLDVDWRPLYPFGHGLSYTSFEYRHLTATIEASLPEARIDVSVEVLNTGTRAGTEVVQLYVTDDVASVTRPVRSLCGFDRVSLSPGEGRLVRFELGKRELGLYDAAMQLVVEPGSFTIGVGGSSQALALLTATLT
jgi:beta-glucosidase